MAGKGFQQFFSMNRSVRSFRTLRQVEQRFAKSRYRKVSIKNPSDFRDFLYEYSLFVGDVNSIPGVNIGVLNSTRGSFLKVGRVMGDATAIMNSVKKMGDKEFKQGTAVGERFVRRYTGRLTGRALGKTKYFLTSSTGVITLPSNHIAKFSYPFKAKMYEGTQNITNTGSNIYHRNSDDVSSASFYSVKVTGGENEIKVVNNKGKLGGSGRIIYD